MMNEKAKADYEERLNLIIEERIEEMEREEYRFPKRFQKKDYLFLIAVGMVCLGFIIFGARL